MKIAILGLALLLSHSSAQANESVAQLARWLVREKAAFDRYGRTWVDDSFILKRVAEYFLGRDLEERILTHAMRMEGIAPSLALRSEDLLTIASRLNRDIQVSERAWKAIERMGLASLPAEARVRVTDPSRLLPGPEPVALMDSRDVRWVRKLDQLPEESLQPVVSQVLSADGNTLVTLTQDHTLRALDITRGVEKYNWRGTTGPERVERVLAVSPDGKTIVVRHANQQTRVFTFVERGFMPEGEIVDGVARIVPVEGDGHFRDLPVEREIGVTFTNDPVSGESVPISEHEIAQAGYIGDGEVWLLVNQGTESHLLTYDLLESPYKVSEHLTLSEAGDLHTLRWSPDKRRILTVSNRQVRVTNVGTQDRMWVWNGHGSPRAKHMTWPQDAVFLSEDEWAVLTESSELGSELTVWSDRQETPILSVECHSQDSPIVRFEAIPGTDLIKLGNDRDQWVFVNWREGVLERPDLQNLTVSPWAGVFSIQKLDGPPEIEMPFGE